MKIAVSGKGGVGKTTLVALLAQEFANSGYDVLAVDGDSSPCLALTLGFPEGLRERITPIVEMRDLIEERTGAKPGTTGAYFTLNPKVDDIPERFSAEWQGVRLLELGTIEQGGAGCICPESTLLKSLLTHLLLRPEGVLLLDMYAGVEHLGRAAIDFVDMLLIVVEPTNRSLETAERIRILAQDIGIRKFGLVGNKIRDNTDLSFIKKALPKIPLMGYLPFSELVQSADRERISVYDHVPILRRSSEEIFSYLIAYLDHQLATHEENNT